jgi:ADP-ribose pyrophosphatase YjhB (NUDIX family)
MDPQYSAIESGPAACLIKLNGELLVIQKDHDKLWSLPGHKAHNQQSAQCAAHHGVWKSTGLNVEVGKLLASVEHIQYFSCFTGEDLFNGMVSLPLPPWANDNISKIALVNPFETEPAAWSRTISIVELREMFNKIE